MRSGERCGRANLPGDALCIPDEWVIFSHMQHRSVARCHFTAAAQCNARNMIPSCGCTSKAANTTRLPGSNLTYDLPLGSAAAPQNEPYCYSANRMPRFNLFCDLTGDFWMPGQR